MYLIVCHGSVVINFDKAALERSSFTLSFSHRFLTKQINAHPIYSVGLMQQADRTVSPVRQKAIALSSSSFVATLVAKTFSRQMVLRIGEGA